MKKTLPTSIVYRTPLLTLSSILAGASIVSAKEPLPVNDTKPAISTFKKIDKEQMRLAKVIHKKILETHAKEAKKNTPFEAYIDQIQGGVKFKMQPIKSKPFLWKGEKKEDLLKVSLDDFWMASTETSWTAFEKFYPSDEGFKREKDGSPDELVRPHLKNDIDFLARPTPQYYPVTWGMPKEGYSAVGVTHHSANKFCQWLSYQTGHFYRLPTEAEWEYACRAGSDKKYSWGDDPKLASQYAWFSQAQDSHYNNPAKKKPNAFGLYDMHGNVLEITLDGYVANRKKHFGKNKVHNPWVKATKPYPHVTKGGTWKHPLEKITASTRIPTEPKWKITDPQSPKSIWALSDAPFLGFRIVRPTKTPTAEEMYHYWNSSTEHDGEMAIYR